MNTSVVRFVAIGASAVAALLYLGIGLGVLAIGGAADGSNPGLFEFGVMMAVTFGITTALLWLVRSRVLWAAVAMLQVIVLLGYMAFAGYREPSFELWGATIKVAQVIILAAVLYLFAHAREATASSGRGSTLPKGRAA